MSRSCYVDDCDSAEANLWRGAVEKAIHGKRGQKMLRELAKALDAMPEKKLIAEQLECGTNVCAMGALGRARGMDLSKLNPYDPEQVAKAFGVAPALVREIAFINDESWLIFDPKARWEEVRSWVKMQLRKQT